MPALSYDDIVWACTNLCDLIEFENEALERHDVATIRELSANKSSLARIYEQSIAPMRDDPSLAEALEPEQKEDLLALGKRLQVLVEENAKRLKIEMEVRQMLMDSMVSAAKANATQTTHYSKSGAFSAAATGEPNSLAFNKTL
ncbi:hypothetical protein [Magnetospirillum moscoviense]|uniref:Flagellar protein FlgN n=1 Tax=Magnetospirillum moscoviense TaxID=1437059 RepID=A0A178MQ44_9PROT|nr:hypothetical protein [Magnetospirillum moscoviense]MBF0324012.1 flagellar protein FlgN [Alphaproteobacteria bacterium]OAN50769.1 hypothetical protein A6A05_11655 [Magnetospirillum moscoviense]